MARKRAIYTAFFSVFILIFAFLVWKCRYGYAHVDETFFLTIPLRLCKGDCLIVDEWHPSQLFGFLLYPLMKVYLWITNNSTEGIMLNFRYIYTVVWGANALFIFFRLKSKSLPGAMFSAFFFMLYAPFNIMALSYNSLGIMLLLDACILIYTSEKAAGLQQCVAGFLYAGAVLCCPYLIALYILFTVIALLCRKSIRNITSVWLMVTLGCAVMFAFFCLFVFIMRRTSLSDFLRSVPELFKDPKHVPQSIIQVTINYVRYIVKSNRIIHACLIIIAATMVISKLKKKAAVGFIVTICMIIVTQIYYLLQNSFSNFLMFPINLIVPYCVLYSKKKEIRWPFWMIWLPGLVYTYCINIGSDQRFFAISSASTVMTAASVMIMFAFLPELKQEEENKTLLRRTVSIMTALLLGLQFCSELYTRYSQIYWEDDGMPAQTVMADTGTEKGILVTPERYDQYITEEKDMAAIRDDASVSNLLILSKNTNLFLSAGKDIAAYSAWLAGVNDYTMERLDRYFDLRPGKVPDTVYVEEEYSEYIPRFLENGFSSEQLESGAFLLKK